MSTNNKFLYGIMNPSGVENQVVPNLELDPTFCKSVKMATTFTVNYGAGTTGNYLFQWHPYSSRPCIVVYRELTYLGAPRYVYHSMLFPDERIYDDFRAMRLVSAILGVESNTVSIGNTIISGTINAIEYQEMPPIRLLAGARLSPYADDPKNALEAAPLQTGVIALATPHGQYGLRQPTKDFDPTLPVQDLSIQRDIQRLQQPERVITFIPPSDPGWNGAPIPTASTVNIFDSVNSTSEFPNNIVGRCKATARLRLTGLNADVVTIGLVARVVRDVAGVATATTVALGSKQITLTTALPGPVSATYNEIDFEFEAAYPIDSLLLTAQAQTYAANGALDYGEMTIDYIDVYSDEFSPGILLAVSGASDSQVITVSGVSNYEVVPDTGLSKNLKTRVKPGDPTEMVLARWMFAADMQCKALYRKAEYNDVIKILGMVTSYEYQKTAHAADWGSFGNFLKGVGKVATSVLPGIIGAFNPQAGMIANQVAGAVAPLFASDQRRGYASDQRRGYAADSGCATSSTATRSARSSSRTESELEVAAALAKMKKRVNEQPNLSDYTTGYKRKVLRKMEALDSVAAAKELDNVGDRAGAIEVLQGDVDDDNDDETLPLFVMPTVTFEPLPYCHACNKPAHRRTETQFRAREHIEQETEHTLNVVGHYCPKGACLTARNLNREVVVPTDRANNANLIDQLVLTRRQFNLDAFILEQNGELVCSNCLNLIDAVAARRLAIRNNLQPDYIAKLDLQPHSPQPPTQQQQQQQQQPQQIRTARASDYEKSKIAKALAKVKTNSDSGVPETYVDPSCFKRLNEKFVLAAQNSAFGGKWAAIYEVAKENKSFAYWINRLILVETEENGDDRAYFAKLCVSLKPFRGATYDEFETNGQNVFIDKRFTDVDISAVDSDTTMMELAKVLSEDLYITLDPTFKMVIEGHSWQAAALAAQWLSSDTVIYTGSLLTAPGELTEKITHCMLQNAQLIILNAPPTINMIAKAFDELETPYAVRHLLSPLNGSGASPLALYTTDDSSNSMMLVIAATLLLASKSAKKQISAPTPQSNNWSNVMSKEDIAEARLEFDDYLDEAPDGNPNFETIRDVIEAIGAKEDTVFKKFMRRKTDTAEWNRWLTQLANFGNKIDKELKPKKLKNKAQVAKKDNVLSKLRGSLMKRPDVNDDDDGGEAV